jgi:predicted Rossmann fold flavoprotein
VLNALLGRLERSGAVLSLGEPALELSPSTMGFGVRTALRTLNASKVVLTTGGQSYPGSGTTGDGYRFAAQLGHRIVPPRPALVPLTTSAGWVAELRGVTLPDVAVRILEGDRSLAQRRGSLLFAHFGLSGPVILDVSRVVSGHERMNTLALEMDLLPAMSAEALATWLRDVSLAEGKKRLAIVLSQCLPRRLAEAVLEQAGMVRDRKAAALSKDERGRLTDALKRLRMPITGTLGFKKAEVTAGGIALEEVDSRTMQSKKVPNLYLAGEVLDLDGPIGGYNFQAAWSTGWLAGESV